jgi:hypothetical protein
MRTIELITREDLEQFRTQLLLDIKKLLRTPKLLGPNKEWLKSYEVREILKISPSTLQNFRINGVLKYEKLGGIFYYAQADIDRLLGKMGNVQWNWPHYCPVS